MVTCYVARVKKPSAALVISIIALVFAATGTGWAVTQLPRNSVGTPQLKNSAVISSKVKDGSLSATDFAAGQLPAGATGATGATGAAGARGPSDAWVFTSSDVGFTFISVSVLESTTLPAGSYTAIAILSLSPMGSGASVECGLMGANVYTEFPNGASSASITLPGAVTLSSPGTIAVTCRTASGLSRLNEGKLIVTRVETLTSDSRVAGFDCRVAHVRLYEHG